MKYNKKVEKIIFLLKQEYPDSKTFFKSKNPFHVVAATMLSAQSTDRQVHKVTGKLFKKYKTVSDFADANLKELERNIKSIGLYKSKARNIKKTARIIMENYEGKVPERMGELIELPGIGRKTANIVLGRVHGVVEGIAVDTHVKRLSQRLGFSDEKNPIKIEKDLMRIIPKKYWPEINRLLMAHGRAVCKARNPSCERCALNKLCPSAFTF